MVSDERFRKPHLPQGPVDDDGYVGCRPTSPLDCHGKKKQQNKINHELPCRGDL